MVALTNLLAVLIADAVAPDSDGFGRALIVAGIAMVFAAPLLWGVARMAKNQAIREGAKSAAHERQMASEARRREFETRLANALEMAEGEPEAHDAIERAFSAVVPEAPVELLLADNSHAHLDRMVVSSVAGGEAPGCPVDSPEHCPAAAPGPDPAVRRQRGARRLPEAARPGSGPMLGRLRPDVDHGSDRRRHPHDRHARYAPRRLAHRRPGDAREPGRCPARHAAGHGGDAAPGVDRRPHRAHQPAHPREPRPQPARRRSARSRS